MRNVTARPATWPFDAKASLEEVAAAWRHEYDLNVLTAVLLATALLPVTRRLGGRIISISSVAALRGGAGAYSAAKAALHGWSLDLAPNWPRWRDGQRDPARIEFFGPRMTQDAHVARVRQTLVNAPAHPRTSRLACT